MEKKEAIVVRFNQSQMARLVLLQKAVQEATGRYRQFPELVAGIVDSYLDELDESSGLQAPQEAREEEQPP